jgi:cytochrome c biogenesis protein CcmG, thiol:disulfide interchange protein DsbE
MKRVLLLLPVLLFAAVALFFAFGLTRDPSKLPSTLIDRPLPPFDLAGLTPGGPGLTTADLKGEPALLNVFASWCLPCRVEHPVLMELAGQGVPIYGLDWKEPAADGAKWIAEYGNPYRRIGSDATGRAGIDLGVTGVPETFVVDAGGRVRYKHIGPISREDWEETLKPLLEKLRREA